MAQRRTNQTRANDGRYETNEHCAGCAEDLGQLDDGGWEFGPAGEFLCIPCAEKAQGPASLSEIDCAPRSL
jgi:hypothetical protein